MYFLNILVCPHLNSHMQYKSKVSNIRAAFRFIICTGIFLFNHCITSFAQLVPPVREQNNNYFFRHIDQQDGLAHNNVYDITQDSKGFIWMVTTNGLQRYDGSRFLNFQEMLTNPYDPYTTEAVVNADNKTNCLWISKRGTIEKLELTKNRFTIYKPEQLLLDPA